MLGFQRDTRFWETILARCVFSANASLVEREQERPLHRGPLYALEADRLESTV